MRYCRIQNIPKSVNNSNVHQQMNGKHSLSIQWNLIQSYKA